MIHPFFLHSKYMYGRANLYLGQYSQYLHASTLPFPFGGFMVTDASALVYIQCVALIPLVTLAVVAAEVPAEMQAVASMSPRGLAPGEGLCATSMLTVLARR